MTPFNRPFIVGEELKNIVDAVSRGQLSGDGYYTKKCHQWIEERFKIQKSLLTHSCTAALEMSAILCNLEPGDEVIMPSYTFVSTANAFALRGAVPVWCDIRPDTLNIDETKIEELITDRTRAIVPVHYAGVSAEMASIMRVAERHELRVVEDAAQGLGSEYMGKPLGTIGHLGAFSFHETKNIISGEGGALAVNDPSLNERAEIIREKGTNRSQFFRGETEKYTWKDIGSSFLPSELVAAFLYAQLEHYIPINKKRMHIYNRYLAGLKGLEDKGYIQLPHLPKECTHNAHMFYIITDSVETRQRLIAHLKANEVMSVFHYIPLHSSPAGQEYGETRQPMTITESHSQRLTRLPCFYELEDRETDRIIELIHQFFERN